MKTNTSDTPRTDDAEIQQSHAYNVVKVTGWGFARQLERELNEAKQAIHEAQFGKYGSLVMAQERDAWRKCADGLAAAMQVHYPRHRLSEQEQIALAEFDRLKGNQ